VSLHTTNPAAVGTGEHTWSNYARKKIPAARWGAITGTAGSDRRVQNASTITFSTVGATTFGQKAVYAGIWTAAAAGSFIVGGPLTASVTLSAGVKPSFATNAFDVEQD
jgi:hypothetical protein